MRNLSGKRVAILATDGYEQSELEIPLARLKEAGAHVDVVSLKAGVIKGWHHHDWGRPMDVDKVLGEVSASDYDALVLPGGQMNPDTLRVEADAIALIRGFWQQNKVIAAICHAPWLLIEADVVEGRRATSWPSLRTDLANAGASVLDEEVVIDAKLITSRKPDDIPAFNRAVIHCLELELAATA